jgi:SAM-dependent methyltransferase
MSSLKIVAKRALPTWAFDRVRNARVNKRKRRNLVAYAGDDVECPLCGLTFSTFASTGVLEREFWKSSEGQDLLGKDFVAVAKKMCPICSSSERQRLQFVFLRDRMKMLEMSKFSMLDVAPDGFLKAKLFSQLRGEYVSIDISNARRPTFVMDLTDLNFPDDSFDVIICYHVLEHIQDDRKAMREMLRVLRPSGWAVIQVPIWAVDTVEDPTATKDQFERLYGHRGHVRRYGMDYPDRLREAGFDVTLDYFAREIPSADRDRYGIDPAEILFVCRRAMQ